MFYFYIFISLLFISRNSSTIGCCYYKNELNQWHCLENTRDVFYEEIDNTTFLGGAECVMGFYCSEIDCKIAGCEWNSNLNSGNCTCN